MRILDFKSFVRHCNLANNVVRPLVGLDMGTKKYVTKHVHWSKHLTVAHSIGVAATDVTRTLVHPLVVLSRQQPITSQGACSSNLPPHPRILFLTSFAMQSHL